MKQKQVNRLRYKIILIMLAVVAIVLVGIFIIIYPFTIQYNIDDFKSSALEQPIGSPGSEVYISEETFDSSFVDLIRESIPNSYNLKLKILNRILVANCNIPNQIKIWNILNKLRERDQLSKNNIGPK